MSFGKIAEINEIMGLVNLDAFDDTINMNRANYEAYKAGLANVKGITLNRYDESEKCNYHYIVIEIDEENAGISRDQLIDLLHRENVIARR
ncbi:MAG: DegT/DnrJ/EryC1/StrS family aminotransferase, partial [Gammaproteobacteria bacterium]|nr:DegT/DnrJ/EryC1/StrS family aminotransferase [Gammaproteobacteria bacterium]